MTASRLDSFSAAWVRSDLDALREYLATDVVYSPLNGDVVCGRDRVLRRFAEVIAGDEGCEVAFEPAEVNGRFGTCRWRMSGRTACGATFTVEGVDLYEFVGDRIRLKDVYQKA